MCLHHVIRSFQNYRGVATTFYPTLVCLGCNEYVHYNKGTVNDSIFYSVHVELHREVITNSSGFSLSVTQVAVSWGSKILSRVLRQS
jgi:hypothetical protein